MGQPKLLARSLARATAGTRWLAIGVCSPDGRWLARSPGFPEQGRCRPASGEISDEPRFAQIGGEVWHVARFLLGGEISPKPRGELVVLQLPSAFGAGQSRLTRRHALSAFVILVFVICLVTVLVHQWSVSRPVERASQALLALVRWDLRQVRSLLKGGDFSPVLRALLKGDVSRFRALLKGTELEPFVDDMNEVLLRLRQNPQPAEPETSWNAVRLRHEVKHLFGNTRMCVIANREPYIHNRKGKQIEVLWPASGLVTALEPIVRACAGVWIGHGSGTADKGTADEKGIVLVPPGNPEYALKRVWLSPEEERGYYYGFANEGLWPLCHIAHTRPTFRGEDWESYCRVNEKFASAFSEEMRGTSPIALIQDYHFAMLPGILRRRRPDAITSLFWHIPWPNPEVIRICPWRNELLEGMLGADLIGFHIQYHCNNFLDTVDRFLEARVDRESFSVTLRGHTCYIRPFPISVEWPHRHQVPASDIPSVRQTLIEELGLSPETMIGLGVDRLDYTKGIMERLLAVEKCLEMHPDLVGRFVFIQIASPSRTHIRRYQELEAEVRAEAQRINFRFRRDSYEPIQLRISHYNAAEVFRFYLAADVCVVTSLHDGMNLVAKEYVAARNDLGGALVLSSFTGAATELTDALIVNPYNVEETASAIHRALRFPAEERRERMRRLRAQVANNNIYAWAKQFLGEIKRISETARTARLAAG